MTSLENEGFKVFLSDVINYREWELFLIVLLGIILDNFG